jgi:hypothetical protein
MFGQHNCNEHDFGPTYCNKLLMFFQHIALNELEFFNVLLIEIGRL